ncbi:MAG: hypothetical protein ACYSUQ_08230 [Planctomycetota bacterium]|jgi:hypothetical protein
MNAQPNSGLRAALVSGIALATVCLVMVGRAEAQEQVAQVTMMAGAPRMVGEAIRPLQAILSGRQLETGPEDAAGLLVEDVVVHVGVDSVVTVADEPGRKRVVLDRGYLVFYTEPQTRSEVVVETPFGLLTAYAGSAQDSGSGWYAVRHDPERPNVSPAVSTFAAIEGSAQVEGTAPVAGPHKLLAGQRWRIVGGRVPGPPEAGDERGDADSLRQMLHRQAAEMIRAQTTDITRLASTDLGPTIRSLPLEVAVPEHQMIIDSNAAAQDRHTVLVPLIPTLIPFPVPEIERERFVYADPTIIPAGTPGYATGGFVSYEGVPADPNWNDFLTSVDGNPAFQPTYLTSFANGGFTYLQFVGPEAQLATNNGETFLATEVSDSSGWAMFTPLVAIGDPGFDSDSSLASVVTEGFRAIANGEHLAGGGTIGGDGVDPDSGFAVVSGTNVELNPNPPAGFPQLDQAADTTGLTVGGQAVSDQIAALGAGHDPQLLHELGPQLVFLSSSDTDALGNQFNFDGDPIQPTDLNLPGDRQVQVDTSGAASQATPLSASEENTVGIQFAGQGETIAIIHHTGLGGTEGTAQPTSEHFEIVRGSRESVVQWREGERVTGSDGQVLEAEDLNGDPELRNELFALISEEVNSVVPPDRHTVGGPAVTLPGSSFRQLRRQPGLLVRVGDTIARRQTALRRPLLSGGTRALRIRALTPAGGRLVRSSSSATSRRHLGRVTTRP